MSKHNEENERIKRRYLSYLKEARRQSEASLDAAAAAIDRFDVFHGRRSFKAFHPERAIAFKRHLTQTRTARSGKPLSQSTMDSTLRSLVGFFSWLADQPGYRSRFTTSDAQHFNLALAEARAGRARTPRPSPTLEQVHYVLARMPATGEIEMRDRALVALTLLTCPRDGALRTLRLKHLDLPNRLLHQNPREVATKFSKQITTTFFPVGGQAETIVRDWVTYLRSQLLWGPDDPLFPSTRVERQQVGGFAPVGLKRAFWAGAEPVRRIFRAAFEGAGLPYFHPHSFRHTLAKLGTQLCVTPEHLKAWSQNLGHEQVLTTLNSYGAVTVDRQAELIRQLSVQPVGEPYQDRKQVADALKALLKQLEES